MSVLISMCLCLCAGVWWFCVLFTCVFHHFLCYYRLVLFFDVCSVCLCVIIVEFVCVFFVYQKNVSPLYLVLVSGVNYVGCCLCSSGNVVLCVSVFAVR